MIFKCFLALVALGCFFFLCRHGALSMSNERNLVTFVCTANICRSPMAARLLEVSLGKDPGLAGRFKVVSAGISAMDGEEPSLNSLQVMEAAGMDISDHRSQRLTQDLVNRSAVIFCMTNTHKLLMQSQFTLSGTSVYLMRELMGTGPAELPDPYGQPVEAYELTFEQMKDAIPSILDFLRNQTGKATAPEA